MIGNLEIMDWVGLGAIVGILGVLVSSYWNNDGIKDKFEQLEKGQEDLKNILEKLIIQNHNNLGAQLRSEREIISVDTKNIKHDTEYVCDSLKEEKMSRLKLYENISNASDVLKTIDVMRETVVANQKLEVENQNLRSSVNELEVKISDLSDVSDKYDSDKIVRSIDSFQRRLAEFDGYSSSEEIASILNKIKNELEEYI